MGRPEMCQLLPLVLVINVFPLQHPQFQVFLYAVLPSFCWSSSFSLPRDWQFCRLSQVVVFVPSLYCTWPHQASLNVSSVPSTPASCHILHLFHVHSATCSLASHHSLISSWEEFFPPGPMSSSVNLTDHIQDNEKFLVVSWCNVIANIKLVVLPGGILIPVFATSYDSHPFLRHSFCLRHYHASSLGTVSFFWVINSWYSILCPSKFLSRICLRIKMVSVVARLKVREQKRY